MSEPLFVSKSITVDTLLQYAMNGETTIPCIQRPFVWTPCQIASFVDSLLRGWPYGTMLFLKRAEVGESLFDSRRFSDGLSAEEKQEIEEKIDYTYLVLDGQQRYQSMYVALSPATQGYEASGKDWADDGCPVVDKKANLDKYVRFLCFNLAAWMGERFADSYAETESLDSAGISWRTQEEIDSADGQYVRMSDIWAGLDESRSGRYAGAMTRVSALVSALKSHSVPVLLINQDECGSAGEREDAVVRMFTRLNMAGTPLTGEQLLAATIKKSWSCFPERLSEFRTYFAASQYKMELSIDDVVNGFNVLLKAVTRQDEARNAYKLLSREEWEKYWSFFFETTQTLIDDLSLGKLIRWKREYGSLYLLWYAVALLVLKQKQNDHLVDISTEVNNIIHALIKWIFVSTWSGIWSNRSGQSVRHYLNELLKLSDDFSPTDVLMQWVEDKNLQQKAIASVERLMASSRGDVRQYYTYLLVWSRMDSARAKLLTRFGRDEFWDVDHLVPYAWSKSIPELKHPLSNIGNCWLLDSIANIRKSDAPFTDFLESYQQEYKLNDIAGAIEAEVSHLTCNEHEPDATTLKALILKREETIKFALKQYITNAELMVLSYETEEPALFNARIYAGERYMNSNHYRGLKTDKCKSSYLCNIGRVHKALNWDKTTGPCPAGTPEKAVDEYIKNNAKRLLIVPSDYYNAKSAWKAYISFITGEKVKGTRKTKNPAREKLVLNNVSENDDWPEYKVGKIAREVLATMLSEGCATESEIQLLQTEEHSKRVFDIQYPLLKKADTEQKPKHYYKDVITINEVEYFLCCEWFEQKNNNDRQYLLEWIKEHKKQ